MSVGYVIVLRYGMLLCLCIKNKHAVKYRNFRQAKEIDNHRNPAFRGWSTWDWAVGWDEEKGRERERERERA